MGEIGLIIIKTNTMTIQVHTATLTSGKFAETTMTISVNFTCDIKQLDKYSALLRSVYKGYDAVLFQYKEVK